MDQRASASALDDLWACNAAATALERDARFARACAERIQTDLAGVYFNPSAALVPLRPVILPEARRKAFADAALTLTRLIRRVTGAITDDPAELARRVGLSRDQLKLLGAAGPAHEFEYGTCNGRLDFVPSNGTPLFLEANFSAANLDPIVAQRLFVAYEALYGIAPRSGPTASIAPSRHGRGSTASSAGSGDCPNPSPCLARTSARTWATVATTKPSPTICVPSALRAPFRPSTPSPTASGRARAASY